MGKKTTPTNKPSVETNVVAEPTPTPEVVENVVDVVEKPKKKRAKKTVASVETETATTTTTTTTETPDVAEETVADSVEINAETTATTEASGEKKKRRVVNKESFLKSSEDFQKELLPFLEQNNQKKLIKAFKVLLSDAYKLMKIKTQQKRNKDASNSGFMRPVKPSVALEKFLTHVGEDLTTPLTRAHLTTVICKYIKDNDLQNPKDRRIIFPDEEFKKLFQITENDTEPLTYYNIQKRIQSHVSRIEDVVA